MFVLGALRLLVRGLPFNGNDMDGLKRSMKVVSTFRRRLKQQVRRLSESLGYTVVHKSVLENWLQERCAERVLLSSPVDQRHLDLNADSGFIASYVRCKQYSLTTVERLFSLREITLYVVNSDIPGAIVECGVWKGGSMMMSALTLLERGVANREMYLYDTYSGMTRPTDVDIDHYGIPAIKSWEEGQRGEINEWCYAPYDEVERNLHATGYPVDKIKLIKGDVLDTLPAVLPSEIAILRLDTDFYESTLRELECLFPLLVSGGILILDDYGLWEGQRRAVDEYFQRLGYAPLMHRVDHACRVIVKDGRQRR